MKKKNILMTIKPSREDLEKLRDLINCFEVIASIYYNNDEDFTDEGKIASIGMYLDDFKNKWGEK